MATCLVGKDCAVKVGTHEVSLMGTWTLSGITADQLECTSFGDNWKSYQFGAKDGGQVTFNGFLDPSDETGQEALRLANIANTDLTTIRLYVDNTSYYVPCQTTGYFSPYNTTGIDTLYSWVNVTAFDMSADKSGLVTTNFTCKVSGVMVLV